MAGISQRVCEPFHNPLRPLESAMGPNPESRLTGPMSASATTDIAEHCQGSTSLPPFLAPH